MGFLQFLSGSRDQEFQELNPSASLNLGSAEGSHIHVPDPGVDGTHCTIYPAQGQFWLKNEGRKTILNLQGMQPQATAGLTDGMVFIVGSTFVKFWVEKPAGAGGGAAPAAAAAGGGADPAELEQLKKQLAAAEAEVEQMRGQSGSAGQELEAARAESERLKGELEQVQAQVTELTEGKTEAERTTQRLQGEIDGAKESAEREASEARAEAEKAKTDAEEQVTKAKADAEEQVTKAKTDAEEQVAKAQAEAEEQVAQAKAEAEQARTEAREEAERSTQQAREALEASQHALDGLKDRADALCKDRVAALAEPSDLQAALEALKLPEAVRVRLEEAVASQVDREVLRRMSGPVVPLRGLRAPGSDDDLEGELRAAREREQRIGLARTLGLHELEASDLDRLLEMAKG
jgi:FHA domain